MGGTEHLTVRREGATLVLTLNRPEAKNALSLAMLVGLYDGWLEADADDAVRSVVLTGAGGAFCAGMDLKALAGHRAWRASSTGHRLKADPDLHWKAMLRHHRPRKPVIAAVEGYCVAGGTEILQGTDIRVAGESATFGLFEVRRGLFPIGGSTVRLQRQIPRTHALEMLLTGRPYSAPRRPRTSAWSACRAGRHGPGEGPGDRRARQRLRRRWRSRPSRRRCTRRAELTETDGLAAELDRRLAGLRHRGRQGGPPRLRREAPAPLQARVTLRPASGRCGPYAAREAVVVARAHRAESHR